MGWERRASGQAERGSVYLFLLVGILPVIFGLCGLAIDGWRLIAADRAVNSVVDASADAGGAAIDETAWRESNTLRLDPAQAESQARDNLASQPEAPHLEGVDISATTERVTVSVSMPVPLTLLRLFTTSDLTVHAIGTATPRRGA